MRCRKMASRRGGTVGVVVTGCCTSGQNLPDPSPLNMQETLRNKCFLVQLFAAGVSASAKNGAVAHHIVHVPADVGGLLSQV